MALVRISKELLEGVSSQIGAMRHKELNEENPQPPAIQVDPLSQKVISLYEPMWELMQQAPERWFATAESLNFKYQFAYDGKPFTVTVPFQSSSGAKFRLPRTGHYGYCADTSHVKLNEQDWPQLADWRKWVCTAHDVGKKYDKVAGEVKAYLLAFPSLNKAVESWPAVKLYVPKEYLARLETTVVRTVTQVAPPEIDKESLTAIGAAHRLRGKV